MGCEVGIILLSLGRFWRSFDSVFRCSGSVFLLIRVLCIKVDRFC